MKAVTVCSALTLFLDASDAAKERTNRNTDWGEDNWGAPNHPVQHWKGVPMIDLSAQCDWGFTKFSEKMEGATVNWYKTTPDWQNFKGYDMVPENHHLFPNKMRFGALDTLTYPSEILGGKCDMPVDEDGVRWTFERIGPFKSYGGYDWWQFAWDDPFKTSQILEEFPDGFYVLNHFSGPVDEAGNILEFPPIHVHHVHVSPGKMNNFRQSFSKCLTGEDEQCSHSFHTVFEQHGDYQCQEADGGTQCLLEDLPEGYGKLVTGPIIINGELNDVRAFDSEELVWWYQAAMRWVPKKHVEQTSKPRPLLPMSLHYMWSPGRLDINDQSTMVQTYKSPTAYDTMIWYTGRMHYSASLIRGKLHAHNTVFYQSYFFAGTPEQLGMLSKRFIPAINSFDPIPLSDMGFSSADDAMGYIMDAYHKNYETPDARGQLPRLICRGYTDHATIKYPTGTFKFDRRAPTWCREWEFNEGDHFVVIGFNQHAGGPPGPHNPNTIPPWLPGHLHWFLSVDTHDGQSHYDYGFYTQETDQSYTSRLNPHFPFGGPVNLVTYLINGGTPTSFQYRKILTGLGGIFVLVLAVLALLGFGVFKGIMKLTKKD